MDIRKDDAAALGRSQVSFKNSLASHKFSGVDMKQILPIVGQQFMHLGSSLKKKAEDERGKVMRQCAGFGMGIKTFFNGLHQFPVISQFRRYDCNVMKDVNNIQRHVGSWLRDATSGFRRQQSRPLIACMSSTLPGMDTSLQPKHLFDVALTTDQVSRRLDGVPVYTVSNSSNEFVLISEATGQKSLGLFCFRQEDAESLLAQVKDREPVLGRGAKVVAVSLDKVYKLNTEGIAFRFLPDPLQVQHALQAKSKGGSSLKAFDGVPVFQSDNLILRSSNRRFCPVFFRKEDLEGALIKALKKQQRGSPSLPMSTDIQVGSFEDVLKKMENNDEDSGWDDIVFIPPGTDAFYHLGKASQISDTVVG